MSAVSALSDIQRSLNTIRAIERKSNAEVRLSALALLTATSSEIAKGLRGTKRTPEPKKVKPKMPQARIPNAPKKQAQKQTQTEPRPFTEPRRNSIQPE